MSQKGKSSNVSEDEDCHDIEKAENECPPTLRRQYKSIRKGNELHAHAADEIVRGIVSNQQRVDIRTEDGVHAPKKSLSIVNFTLDNSRNDERTMGNLPQIFNKKNGRLVVWKGPKEADELIDVWLVIFVVMRYTSLGNEFVVPPSPGTIEKALAYIHKNGHLQILYGTERIRNWNWTAVKQKAVGVTEADSFRELAVLPLNSRPIHPLTSLDSNGVSVASSSSTVADGNQPSEPDVGPYVTCVQAELDKLTLEKKIRELERVTQSATIAHEKEIQALEKKSAVEQKQIRSEILSLERRQKEETNMLQQQNAQLTSDLKQVAKNTATPIQRLRQDMAASLEDGDQQSLTNFGPNIAKLEIQELP